MSATTAILCIVYGAIGGVVVLVFRRFVNRKREPTFLLKAETYHALKKVLIMMTDESRCACGRKSAHMVGWCGECNPIDLLPYPLTVTTNKEQNNGRS